MEIDEQVAIFLHILAHHVKNRVIKQRFKRSSETISRHFQNVLNAVTRLQGHLLKTPEPVLEDSTDEKWKWFKGCVGALDGTYISVHVPTEDKPKYRSRTRDIGTNVLRVLSQDMGFIYVLPDWEGSTADGRVLRDTMIRRNGLLVNRGSYYLVDGRYTNDEGFLAPFRGQRYHLKEWRDGHQPRTLEEFFNMKNSSAGNIIERCFGLQKKHWPILRSPSFYPIKIQNCIIIAFCLLHNYIRDQMPIDPIEAEVDAAGLVVKNDAHDDRITTIETSNE